MSLFTEFTPADQQSSIEAQTLMAMTPQFTAKLNELEKEIERFRNENSELAKLKKEREGEKSQLRSIISPVCLL